MSMFRRQERQEARRLEGLVGQLLEAQQETNRLLADQLELQRRTAAVAFPVSGPARADGYVPHQPAQNGATGRELGPGEPGRHGRRG